MLKIYMYRIRLYKCKSLTCIKAWTHIATLCAILLEWLHVNCIMSTPEIVVCNIACSIAGVQSCSTSAILHTTISGVNTHEKCCTKCCTGCLGLYVHVHATKLLLNKSSSLPNLTTRKYSWQNDLE